MRGIHHRNHKGAKAHARPIQHMPQKDFQGLWSENSKGNQSVILRLGAWQQNMSRQVKMHFCAWTTPKTFRYVDCSPRCFLALFFAASPAYYVPQKWARETRCGCCRVWTKRENLNRTSMSKLFRGNEEKSLSNHLCISGSDPLIHNLPKRLKHGVWG